MSNLNFRHGGMSFLNGLIPSCNLGEFENCLYRSYPRELNTMLRSHQLQVSAVSSLEYLRSPDLYTILPDLSISGHHYVQSVCVVSNWSPEQWHKKEIKLTMKSETSVALLKILCWEYLKISPIFTLQTKKEDEPPLIELKIGDEALLATYGPTPCWDLCELWKSFTGMDYFVFALWLVSEQFQMNQPKTLQSLHQHLLESVQYGLNNPEIFNGSRPSWMPASDFKRYLLKHLNYSLSEEHQESLQLFSTLLKKYQLC
jgi:chorismate dehydratase